MQKKQSNTTALALALVALAFVLSWVFGKIPEQKFWYDQTAPCPTGTQVIMSGNALVCR